ncbi:MAG: hypothetical protein QNJ82_00075 [Gammaproteobacteria bacterium]|nr:hypothetical protein [Gammaproteobacteria bacterium]
MRLRPVSAFGRPAGAESSSHELEALQTDVMRFMAILGFCLMAIFALVQSLPVGPGDPRPKLEHPEQVELDLAAMKRQAQRLRLQLGSLEQDLEAVRAEMREALAQREEAERLRRRYTAEAAEAEQRRKKSTHRLERTETSLDWVSRLVDRARVELDSLSGSLARARRALANTESEHKALEQQITERRRTLTDLRRELRGERQALSATEAQLQEVARELAQYQPPVRESAPEAEQPTEPGFTLHFASENSLSALVRGKQVRLYALLGRQAWTLREGQAGARFEREEVPNTYFEMHAHTVPGRYLKAMGSVAVDPLKLTWGVTLPEQTRRRITELMSRRRGGDLVIHEDGRVSIH